MFRGASTGVARIYVANYDNNTVTTYKNTGTKIKPKITQGLKSPWGVAVDASGKIYVASQTNNTVTTYTAKGVQTTPTITTGLNYPRGIAVDVNGKIYVANANNNTITTYNPDGTQTTPTITAGLSGPSGVAVDASGKIYVVNVFSNTVTTYNAGGTQTTPTITAGLTGPEGLAVDGNGKIYVADTYNNNVLTYNADGSPTTPTITAGLNAPMAVTVDANGKIYVANSRNNTVTTYNAHGTQTTPTITAGVHYPAGVALYAPLSSYAVLYSFTNYDGHFPMAGLINVNGTLYGTTTTGGPFSGCGGSGCGTVFAITPSGTETVLHNFGGGSADGANPNAGLLNFNGTLYGTTSSGGANGDGTIFTITPSGAEAVVYSFKGGSTDGASPNGALLNINDLFWGTTTAGGANGDGTVFTYDIDGTETVWHSFNGGPADGANPNAGLNFGTTLGTLYGTTTNGGANGDGTVFKIELAHGLQTVIYSFKGGPADGAHPHAGLLQPKESNLYGTTTSGGATGNGTVFKITKFGAETVLHSFGQSGDGALPYASLINVRGTLYGTTILGGASGSNDLGTVFAITTSGTETVLHTFVGSPNDGQLPYAALINVNGTLYGTTSQGGPRGWGTVFSLTP
jgi:uncharacterized repeat protein (TIGR03803 family)/YVTN family beta-propeller protein